MNWKPSNDWYSFQTQDINTLLSQKVIKLYIEDKNRREILQDIKNYKKLNYDELVEDKFERKSYFSAMNIENSKIMFRDKNQVLPPISKNFPASIELTASFLHPVGT